MSVEVTVVSPSALTAHAGVSIAFEADRVLDVTVRDGGLGGLALVERRLAVPYRKDSDAHDGGPAAWPRRFDLTRRGLSAARAHRVGRWSHRSLASTLPALP